jgi:hypothetical protein
MAMSPIERIFEAVLDSKQGNFSAELAQHVLSIKFTDEEKARYEALAYKNQNGALTPEELAEFDAYVTAESFLIVLKSKARRSLLHRTPAA